VESFRDSLPIVITSAARKRCELLSHLIYTTPRAGQLFPQRVALVKHLANVKPKRLTFARFWRYPFDLLARKKPETVKLGCGLLRVLKLGFKSAVHLVQRVHMSQASRCPDPFNIGHCVVIHCCALLLPVRRSDEPSGAMGIPYRVLRPTRLRWRSGGVAGLQIHLVNDQLRGHAVSTSIEHARHCFRQLHGWCGVERLDQ